MILNTYFIISFLGWVLLETWVIFRERGRLKGNQRDRGSKILLTVAVVVGIFLAVIFNRIFLKYSIHDSSGIVFICGIVLIWFGILFRFWSINTLGKYFRTVVLIQDDHKIIEDGPYAYLRHPAYTGSVITFVGIGLAMTSWASLIILIISILAGYFWRIHVEEKLLLESFGDKYRDYMKKTWAIIPFIW